MYVLLFSYHSEWFADVHLVCVGAKLLPN